MNRARPELKGLGGYVQNSGSFLDQSSSQRSAPWNFYHINVVARDPYKEVDVEYVSFFITTSCLPSLFLSTHRSISALWHPLASGHPGGTSLSFRSYPAWKYIRAITTFVGSKRVNQLKDGVERGLITLDAVYRCVHGRARQSVGPGHGVRGV